MNGDEATLHAAVLGGETGLLYERYGIAIPGAAGNLSLLIAATCLLGFIAVWLYAAVRPRFGTGPRVAVIAHLWTGVYPGAGYAGVITLKPAWLPVL